VQVGGKTRSGTLFLGAEESLGQVSLEIGLIGYAREIGFLFDFVEEHDWEADRDRLAGGFEVGEAD